MCRGVRAVPKDRSAKGPRTTYNHGTCSFTSPGPCGERTIGALHTGQGGWEHVREHTKRRSGPRGP